jgi:hypothetical protein
LQTLRPEDVTGQTRQTTAQRPVCPALPMDSLHEAVEAGYRGRESLRTEAVFRRLHSRVDFKDLLLDAAFPVEPLAR